MVDLNNLPLDAFDLDDANIHVGSLTAGHWMSQVTARACRPSGCCSC